ncbi:hypothetical protein E0Z10_g955 [Xylaria hypoxylon]|uniref:Uncharacterized protein n=1 Tax=Xylaria hypoxylon TaxID=37992 RepID=A0A4Z0YTZ2_9PEZI|nr:hypothetical protein E0Z10_g955 [Xylaria hypoxylon]
MLDGIIHQFGDLGNLPHARFEGNCIRSQTFDLVDDSFGTAASKFDTLSHILSSVDLTWTHYFLATLFDHDNAGYMREVSSGAFIGSNETSLAGLDPKDAARSVLNAYISNNSEGKVLTLFSVAVENIALTKSQLRWYFNSPPASFAAVRDATTLGGQIDASYTAKELMDLHDLINAVVGLPDEFPDNAELAAAPSFDSSRRDKYGDTAKVISEHLYHFDVAPGMELPEVKIFIPARYYSSNGLTQALGITRCLDEGNGLQTYVACLFKNNEELDITTYLGAEAFHPGRMVRTPRGTLRRGD